MDRTKQIILPHLQYVRTSDFPLTDVLYGHGAFRSVCAISSCGVYNELIEHRLFTSSSHWPTAAMLSLGSLIWISIRPLIRLSVPMLFVDIQVFIVNLNS